MNTSPEETGHPWSSDALLNKAVVYAQKMKECGPSDWMFGLMSTFVLEFLARAVLSLKSRAFLADLKDVANLQYAIGYTPVKPRFIPKSISVTLVFSQILELYPSVPQELHGFFDLHMSRRNAELHSGDAIFGSVPDWLPRFYECCDVLLNELGESLELLFGDDATPARNLIAAAKDDSSKVVLREVAMHKKLWEEKSPEDQAVGIATSEIWAMRKEGHRIKCPACGCVALTKGQPQAAPRVSLQDDLIVERYEVQPETFECVACGLKVFGLARLLAIGVGDTYTETLTYTPREYYEVQYSDYEYEPDYNE